MKCYLLIGFWVLQNLFCTGQNYQSNAWHFQPVPDSVTYQVQAFTHYLQSAYKNEEEKLYAIYDWITSTIQYRNDSAYYFTVNGTTDERLSAILRRRRGVCEQFALTLTELCKKAGLNAYLVHGYAESDNSAQNVAHSWCAIYINGNWKLFDPTWDAVNRGNGYAYYMVSPDIFIQSHIPFDPIWQLMEKPIGYRRPAKELFNYKDSISTFLAADSLQQLLAIDRRMQQMVSKKELFKIWQSYNKMQIAIIGNEQDERLYNSAVEKLNKAMETFNVFVQYRNNRFLPAKSRSEITRLLEDVYNNLSAARTEVDQMGKIVDNFQYDTGGLLKKLEALAKRNDEQMSFVTQYYNAVPADRDKLFYQR